MQVSTAEFRKGLRIVFDGNPYTIVDFQHVKPGKGGAFVRTKLKHMTLGKVIDNTFRSGEKVALVDFAETHMQFLYKDDRYHFMDVETYEQVSLSPHEVGDARDWLRENTEVDVLYIEGRPVAVELPNFVELAIAKTDPGVRGDTAQGGTKPATLETGAVILVPLFLNEGDVVKEGQILCIIEAMKLMNEIESKASGRIVKIFVENGHAVEYGQPLFLIDPAH